MGGREREREGERGGGREGGREGVGGREREREREGEGEGEGGTEDRGGREGGREGYITWASTLPSPRLAQKTPAAGVFGAARTCAQATPPGWVSGWVGVAPLPAAAPAARRAVLATRRGAARGVPRVRTAEGAHAALRFGETPWRVQAVVRGVCGGGGDNNNNNNNNNNNSNNK